MRSLQIDFVINHRRTEGDKSQGNGSRLTQAMRRIPKLLNPPEFDVHRRNDTMHGSIGDRRHTLVRSRAAAALSKSNYILPRQIDVSMRIHPPAVREDVSRIFPPDMLAAYCSRPRAASSKGSLA
jgi:hypothetical protein